MDVTDGPQWRSAGEWDKGGDEPRWVQPHEELVKDALHAWAGSPTDMHYHLRAVSEAQEPLSNTNGTYKIQRARALALHTEITERGHVNSKPLYRGSSRQGLSDVPTSWSERKSVANHWAKKSGGMTETLAPGEGHGIRMEDYISSGVDAHERQWLVVKKKKKRGGNGR